MAICRLLKGGAKIMLVKDLIKQLENLPQNYTVGFSDRNGQVTDPTGDMAILNNLEIVLIH